MAKISKRLKTAKELFNRENAYDLKEALSIVRKAATAKFDESVDIAVNLGIDTRKSDQSIRGAVKLPHGTGKDVRVAVFTQGENAEIAKKEGANIVGLEELAADVKKGQINFDVVIATPDAMRVVGALGTILGPRGLMPNPKVGTVTNNVADAIQNVKSGIQFRADKGGVVHTTIGRASFSEDKLIDNFATVLDALVKAKPSAAKGQYIKKVTVSSTMGVGVLVDLSSVNK